MTSHDMSQEMSHDSYELTSHRSRERPQEPALARMELAVMKIPEPMMVPVTKEVAPTEKRTSCMYSFVFGQ